MTIALEEGLKSGCKFRMMHDSLSSPRLFLKIFFGIFCCFFCVAVATPQSGLRAAPKALLDSAKMASSFSWSRHPVLSWADFQGPIRAGANPSFAAETICGISIKTNAAQSDERVLVQVENHFDQQRSWVRPGHATAEVLRHEQGHWDICELYTRILKARFDSAHITGANLQEVVPLIYQSVIADHRKRQQQYEDETQHGTLPEAQQRWEGQIREALQQSSQIRSH